MTPLTMSYRLALLILVALLGSAIPATAGAAERHSVPTREAQDRLSAAARSAVDAGAPSEDIELIISRATAREVDAQTIDRFLAAAGRAGKKGLPVKPVVDRIEQGLAKNVPAGRIAAAAERLVDKLDQARPLVGNLVSGGVRARGAADRAEATEALARALEASISGNKLEEMGKAVQARKGSLTLFSRAVDATTHLAGNGVSPARAADLVRSAVDRGATERDLTAMEKRFSDTLRQGGKADDAAAAFDRDGNNRDKDRDRQNKRSDHGRDSGAGMGGRRR